MSGCCSKTEIISKSTTIMLEGHNFYVTIVFCKHCGSIKSTSHIKDKNPLV